MPPVSVSSPRRSSCSQSRSPCPRWTRPGSRRSRPRPPGVSADDPQIGIDAGGNTTASGPADRAGSTQRPLRLQASRRGLADIALHPHDRHPDCHDPQLAVNALGSGGLVVACEQDIDGDSGPPSPRRHPGARSLPILSSPAGASVGTEPRVGIDDAGNAFAVWANGTTVQSAYRTGRAGLWTDGGQISTAGKRPTSRTSRSARAATRFAVWRETREEFGGDDRRPRTAQDPRRQRDRGADRLPYADSSTPAPPSWSANRRSRSTPPAAHGRLVAGSTEKEFAEERAASGDLSAASANRAADHRIALLQRGIAADRPRTGRTRRRRLALRLLPVPGPCLFHDLALTGLWSTPIDPGRPGRIEHRPEPDVAGSEAGGSTVVWGSAPRSNQASSRAPAAGAFPARRRSPTAPDPPFGEPQVAMDAAGDASLPGLSKPARSRSPSPSTTSARRPSRESRSRAASRSGAKPR